MRITFEELRALINASGSWLQDMDDLVSDSKTDDLDTQDLRDRVLLASLLPQLEEAIKPVLPPAFDLGIIFNEGMICESVKPAESEG
jgi:hypothetical protein